MKKMLVACALLCSQSLLASQIDGTWVLPKMSDGIMDYTLEFTVSDTSLTMTNTCSMGAAFFTKATLTVPARVTESEIITLSSGHKEVDENGINCSIGVDADSMNYKVLSSDKIEISAGGDVAIATKK